MINKHKTQKGFALVVSLLLLLMMTVMGITMIARSNLNTNMSVEYDKSEHIFVAAEAGIEHARRYLENLSAKTQFDMILSAHVLPLTRLLVQNNHHVISCS